MPRKSMGRQKIKMQKMSNGSNLLVTFSKRRNGLFKKASELGTLCGAEIAIIVFSPGKKVFSFGHPCVESILDRYFTRNHASALGNSDSSLQLVEAHRNASVREVNMQFTKLESKYEDEKKIANEINNLKKETQGKCWWACPLEGLRPVEVETLRAATMECRKNMAMELEKVMAEVTTSTPPIPGASTSRASTSGKDGGAGNGIAQVKAPTFGLSITPKGYTLGYPRGFF